MSTEPLPPDNTEDDVLVFAVPEVDHTNDRVPFRLHDDDYVLTAIRCKQAKLLKLVKGVASLDEVSDLAAVSTLDNLMRMVLTPDSITYLEDRFDDDADDVDLTVLEPILKQLVELWWGGDPTGGRRGSSPRQRRTGPRSTVRSRSTG